MRCRISLGGEPDERAGPGRGTAWPDDPEVHDKSYQYMFGDDLLVACMVDETTERDVYFPKGNWIDFWNRSRPIQGPKVVSEAVPLSRFPVYIRKGATFNFTLPKR